MQEGKTFSATEQHVYGSWGNSVSIVSDYRLKDQSSIPSRGRGFSSSLYVQTSFEAHPVLHHSQDQKKDNTINREMKLGKHKRTGINK
jgi:hypothetical protein